MPGANSPGTTSTLIAADSPGTTVPSAETGPSHAPPLNVRACTVKGNGWAVRFEIRTLCEGGAGPPGGAASKAT